MKLKQKLLGFMQNTNSALDIYNKVKYKNVLGKINIFRPVKKLILNIVKKLIVLKNNIFAMFKNIFSRIKKFTQNQAYNDFKDTALTITGYGLITFPLLFTMLTIKYPYEWGYGSILHFIGGGSLIYIFMDVFDYILSTLKKHRNK